MDDETRTRFDALDRKLDGGFTSHAKLIEDHSDSLQREMRAGSDRLETATARNTKVLAGGSKTVPALMAWSEKRDQLDRKRDQEIRDLRARVQKLERGTTKRRAS